MQKYHLLLSLLLCMLTLQGMQAMYAASYFLCSKKIVIGATGGFLFGVFVTCYFSRRAINNMKTSYDKYREKDKKVYTDAIKKTKKIYTDSIKEIEKESLDRIKGGPKFTIPNEYFIRESRLKLWYQDAFKGEGHRLGNKT